MHRFSTRLVTVLVGALLAVPATAATAQVDAPEIGDLPLPEPTAGTQAAQTGGEELVGLFGLTPGSCGGEEVTGSWFRMVDPSGGFVSNSDSACDDDTYTPLEPGADGGLITGEHQPNPDPAFDGSNNALADRITRPTAFFGPDFSTATNPTDPQTGVDVPPPSVLHDGSGSLSGDLRAFAAAWNGQHFNQGAPKPDGSTPGDTTLPTGTYDEASGAYVLQWRSRIQGGPFNGFTGVWHFEGTFESSQADPQPAPDEPDEPAPDPDPQPDQSADPTAQPEGGPADTAGPDPTTRQAAQTGDRELARTGPVTDTAVAVLLLGLGTALAWSRRRATS